MERKDFLKAAVLGTSAAMIPGLLKAENNHSALPSHKHISFGIISDLHQDFTFDAPARLKAFINAMNAKKPDFILQLGDFCVPKDKNKVIMDIWNQFAGDKHHVIGNHEFDEDCKIDQIVQFFQMPNRYYSFDLKGYHFVIMDGNDPNPNVKYSSFIHEDQFSWLESDITGSRLPCIVFCHQGLDNNGVINREAVRLLFENCNKKAGFNKIKAVFSGHHHLDYHNEINGIHYIQINSATYRWLGKPYKNTSLPEEHYKLYPLISYMAYYEDPIWAHIEIDEKGKLTVEGKKTVWKGNSPYDMGMKHLEWDYPSRAEVSSRIIQLS